MAAPLRGLQHPELNQLESGCHLKLSLHSLVSDNDGYGSEQNLTASITGLPVSMR